VARSVHQPAFDMVRYDLHSHSTCSDGLLAPGEVVRRAAARGVDVLALSDHDELAGLAEAQAAANDAGIALVPAAEISVTWEEHTLHVVALHIDPGSAALVAGLAAIRTGRDGRAQRIAAALEAAGIPDAMAGARRHVTSDKLISRSHFARYLVECGAGRDVREVFKRYLTPGKPGYVAHAWAGLGEAIGWIRGAGGVAVLAHPGRYPLSGLTLRRLITEFRALGGTAIEVLSSSHTTAQAAQFATLARVHGLRASAGSDYHGPGESWLDLGDLPPLPAGLTPVWADW
jgi:predicted metal-dependent phosphoesterase TrpH